MTQDNQPPSRNGEASREDCQHCGRTVFLPPEFVSNPGATHWEECWRAHLPCAIVTIERLHAARSETADTVPVPRKEWGALCRALEAFEKHEKAAAKDAPFLDHAYDLLALAKRTTA